MPTDLIIGGLVGVLIAYVARAIGRGRAELDEVDEHIERLKRRAVKEAEATHAETSQDIEGHALKISEARLQELSDMINEEIPDD